MIFLRIFPVRIISGIHRSRKLLAPQDATTTRPITDRVKQALFDRLWALELFPEPDGQGYIMPDGCGLDLFAGTGSLGLEALSRGAAHITFIERDRAIRSLLEKNIQSLGLSDQATVLSADACGSGWVSSLVHPPLRYVFCDPPYRLVTEPDQATERLWASLDVLAETSGLLEPNAWLMLRTPAPPAVKSPPRLSAWALAQTVHYGSMEIHYYAPRSGE